MKLQNGNLTGCRLEISTALCEVLMNKADIHVFFIAEGIFLSTGLSHVKIIISFTFFSETFFSYFKNTREDTVKFTNS